MGAEAEAELSNFAQAETYVNFVRARAAKPASQLYTYIDNTNRWADFLRRPRPTMWSAHIGWLL